MLLLLLPSCLTSLLYLRVFYLNFFISTKVEKFVSQLELIIKGDVVGAKRLDSFSPTEASLPEDSDGSSESCSTIHSGAQHPNNEQSKQSEWTSLQLSEAMSILNNFLKLESKKCKNCSASNPNIRKPTFGWFHWVYFHILCLNFSFLFGKC
jgi:DNA-directed RNA polymerase I subunit RPA1